MPYRDKDKQRQAVREAVRRHRVKSKGITQRVLQASPKVLPDVIPNIDESESQNTHPMLVGYAPPEN